MKVILKFIPNKDGKDKNIDGDTIDVYLNNLRKALNKEYHGEKKEMRSAILESIKKGEKYIYKIPKMYKTVISTTESLSSTSEDGSLSSDEGSLSSDEGSLSSDEGSLSSDEGSLSSDEGSLSSDEGSLSSDEGSLSSDKGSLSSDEGSLSSEEDSVSSEESSVSSRETSIIKSPLLEDDKINILMEEEENLKKKLKEIELEKELLLQLKQKEFTGGFSEGSDSSDSESDTSYGFDEKTYLFDTDSDEESLIDNAKNMKNRKYLNNLNVQELRDIMKSNNLKVSNNGSYLRKKIMVKKILNN